MENAISAFNLVFLPMKKKSSRNSFTLVEG